jgi:hypothetical protein
MRIGSLMAEAERAEVMDTCVRLIYERVVGPTACLLANCQITAIILACHACAGGLRCLVGCTPSLPTLTFWHWTTTAPSPRRAISNPPVGNLDATTTEYCQVLDLQAWSGAARPPVVKADAAARSVLVEGPASPRPTATLINYCLSAAANHH